MRDWRKLLLAAFILCLISVGASSPTLAGEAAANAWIGTAREAAQANEHTKSIRAFEHAMSEEPSKRSEILHEYADQLTYGGRGEEAVPLYREILDTPGISSGEEKSARRGLALALSWTDQQLPALREYQALVAANPGDLDALRSVGRIQSWQGQHRRAVEQLENFLTQYPNDPEGIALLAQALDWMGRPDRAEKVLRDHLAVTPGDKNAERLLEELERSQRPETLFNYRESHQSDNLRITGWELGQDFQFNDGLTTVGPRFHTYRYNPKRNNGPAVSSDIFVYRPGLHVRHRFNDAIEWNGTGWVDVIDEKNGDNTSAPFTYDTWLTLWPNDFFRIDVGSNRTTFDNESSLRQNIKGTFATGSVDMMPDEKTRITGRFRWGDYTDTNEQRWWQAEVERRIWNEPRVHFAARYTGMDFRRTLNNGYFDPNDYHSGEGRIRVYDELLPDLWYHLEVSAGYEDSSKASGQAIWSAAGGFSYWINDWLEVALRYGYFSSKTGSGGGSSGGFDRGTGSLTLRTRW
ncbi:MAG: tetratricopeptide repeat protein [Deltaproteobacteria bacterium]|nr:tetratricopeptide repeat protein [Deltaproteobacteria bacterium]MBW2692474.1 tetratricopeptide repeat protein [Deltaproteobacteria bacterium]